MSKPGKPGPLGRPMDGTTARPAAAEPRPTSGGERGYLAHQLGEGITRAREAAGKSQRAQARDLGIAGNTLRELELGLANPTLSRIEDLAEDLAVTVKLTVTRRRRKGTAKP